MISKHFDKNKLHHAYLIEGAREEATIEILKFVNDLGIKTSGSPDFIHISVDSFEIEDARNLKSYGGEKGFSIEKSAKKIFLISANTILLEAQHSLLKIFEEPIENTHFFVVVPDANSLLKTLVSRFYFISVRQNLEKEIGDANKFIEMPLQKRIDYIKELLTETEEKDDEGNEIAPLDSARSKAINFLNSLELVLHKKLGTSAGSDKYFEHFLKVREFLRMPGSSTKTLMESIALIIPQV